MASEGAEPATGPRLHRLSTWFDPESAAVVTVLLGLFQLLLSPSFAHTDNTLPKLFILPLVLGLLIVAGGSFTIANERSPSRLLLRGCACSNVVGLLGALLAFCLYCYNLSCLQEDIPCLSVPIDSYSSSQYRCPRQQLAVSLPPNLQTFKPPNL
ncbi:uncharacterized protein [Brachyistius frenatus]|uniref:uncharacterized protein n=1 Tax=Brachyistius frenatus TaxID=100188 RepID=UPI0037E83FAF